MSCKITNLLSVVITTHNRQEALIRAVNSIFKQSVLPCKLIIVDDGSRVPVFLESYNDKILVEIIRNDIAKGANYSRNIGVKKADTEIVAFLDDDDEFLPFKVESILSEYESYQPDVITSFAEVKFYPSGKKYEIRPSNNVTFKSLLIRNLVGTTSMVAVKRKFFKDIGGFDESLPARQDYEAWLRCLKNGAKVSCINSVLTLIHVELSSKSISKSLNNNFCAMKLINEIYSKDLYALTKQETRMREIATRQFYCHKYFLAGSNFKGAIFSAESFFVTRSLRFIVLGVGFVLGRWAIIALLKRKKR